MSVSTVDLERQLKTVTKTGKYVVGRREVMRNLKGTKLLVWSASAAVPPQILHESRTLSIPSICFEGNPIELGKTCGIPYKVSVIAVKSVGDAVLTQFENHKDYGSEIEQSAGKDTAQPGTEGSGEKVKTGKLKKKAKDEKTTSEVKPSKGIATKQAETSEEGKKAPKRKKAETPKPETKKARKKKDEAKVDDVQQDEEED